MSYDIGEVAKVRIEVLNANNVLADPTVLRLRVLPPSRVEESHVYPSGISKEATGKYYSLLVLSAAGSWDYRWEAEGTVVVTEEGSVQVRPSVFTDKAGLRIPTAVDIRLWSQVNFAEVGFAAPEGVEADRLDIHVERAIADLYRITGVKLHAVSAADEKVPLIYQAVQMLTEYKILANSQDNVETGADFDMLQNFSAGSYSETRRANNRRPLVLHPWPQLNELLMGLLTPAKIAELGLADAPAVSELEDPADWRVAENTLRIPFERQMFPFPNQWGGWF